MFNIKLEENAGAAYLEALDALKRILDGEGSYKNYRAYVLNLHSSLELFFKKKLYDHNEFMLFSFVDYKNLIGKYKKAFDANKTLFEYVDMAKTPLPHTVTFIDAVERLSYLYKESEFTANYIAKLKSLNTLRNNIMHFELNIEDDQLVLLNELFGTCTDYYSEYLEWGYTIPIDLDILEDKNLNIRTTIIRDKFNFQLLKNLDDNHNSLVDDFLDFNFLADALITGDNYPPKDRDKLVARLQIFENADFFEYGSAGGEHWDVGWFYLSDMCRKLMKSCVEENK